MRPLFGHPIPPRWRVSACPWPMSTGPMDPAPRATGICRSMCRCLRRPSLPGSLLAAGALAAMTVTLKPRKIDVRRHLRSSLQWSQGRTFSGFVLDAADPGQKFVVELLVDGHPVQCVRAADFVADLGADNIGDGCYGFLFSLTESALDGGTMVEVRIANLGIAAGEPVLIGGAAVADHVPASSGAMRWLGGVRFSGWIAQGGEPIVNISVDGEQVDQVRRRAGATSRAVEDARAVRALDFHLPDRFADGSAHRLAATIASGEHLEGSPCHSSLSPAASSGCGRSDLGRSRRASRSAMFDRFVPMSVPFAQYRSWRKQLPDSAASARPLQAAVVMVGAGEIDDTLESPHAQSHPDWIAAFLPRTADHAGFELAAAQEFLAGDGADADFVLFVPSGALLDRAALARISGVFERHDDAVAVYGDVDIAGDDGSLCRWRFRPSITSACLNRVTALTCSRFADPSRNVRSMTAPRISTGSSIVSLTKTPNLRGIVHLPGAIATLLPIDIDAASRTLAITRRGRIWRSGASMRT